MVKEKARAGHKITGGAALDGQTLSTEIFEPMSRKGRHKRSKIPRAIEPAMRNGLSMQAVEDGLEENGVAENSPKEEMVASASSPVSVRPRPQAPVLNFMPPPPPPPEPVRASSESSDGSALAQTQRAPDDTSVPPVDVDAHFFDSTPDMPFEHEARDPHHARKLSPTAARRRAHLAKYVTVAVGLASALCVAALVKSAVARNHEDPRARPASAAQALAVAEPLNAPTTTEPAPSPLPAANSASTDIPAAAAAPTDPPAQADPPAQPEQANAAAPSGAQGQAAPEPPAPPTPPLQVAPPSAAVQDPPAATAPAAGAVEGAQGAAAQEALDPKEAAKEAGKEKAKCRTLLERGKFADAVAAGEQSISLDPTDSEAWLLLGAAYQQKGDAKNAVRSFKACVDQGKRGPKSDCAAMLR